MSENIFQKRDRLWDEYNNATRGCVPASIDPFGHDLTQRMRSEIMEEIELIEEEIKNRIKNRNDRLEKRRQKFLKLKGVEG